MKFKLKLILVSLSLLTFVGCSKANKETIKETKKETKVETKIETKIKTKKETKSETKKETEKETIKESNKNEELKGIVTSDQNGTVTKTNYYAKDNVVTKIEQITDADLSKFDPETVEIFKANIEPTKQKYSKIKGLEYSVNIEDNILHEVLIMHVDNPETLTNLIESKLVAVEKGTTQIKLDKILDQFENAGFNVERR